MDGWMDGWQGFIMLNGRRIRTELQLLLGLTATADL